jgi:hypothetical protein
LAKLLFIARQIEPSQSQERKEEKQQSKPNQTKAAELTKIKPTQNES